MSRIIDVGLEELSAILNRMGELAYHTVLASLAECFEGKNGYGKVSEMSDMLVSMADSVEDKAFELIARFQPVASDLRTIKSYMKIAYDFARFGRYALDISYINRRIGGIKSCDELITSCIREMSEKTLDMIKLSNEALRSHNHKLAEKISEKENEVDKMFFDFLNKLMGKANVPTNCIISSVLIARYLERIADHAAYICEATIYIATGRKAVLR